MQNQINFVDFLFYFWFKNMFYFFQFNVQRLQDAHSLSQPSSSSGVGAGVGGLGDTHPVTGHSLYLQGSAHSSGGSVSSAGGASPNSPLRPGKEEDCSLQGRSSTEGKKEHASRWMIKSSLFIANTKWI